jgi:hypothetical protein
MEGEAELDGVAGERNGAQCEAESDGVKKNGNIALIRAARAGWGCGMLLVAGAKL